MKNIIVGVSSGIACYKVIDLIESLKGFNINVILTKNTLNLVEKKDFEKASKNKVAVETFNENRNYKDYLKNKKNIKHISMAQKADLMIIAPATANIIGKIANGYADDLLTTTVLATTAPILICPSMNVHMWENKIVQNNIQKLKDTGYIIINPEYGDLACGYKGMGRLANLDKINKKILSLTNKKTDLEGKTILITAGPTVAPIDPVRIITNKSSGKMGYSLAQKAALRGAKVILISGPTNLQKPFGVKTINVISADEMYKSVKTNIKKADVFICAAAVADFKINPSKNKIKKQNSFILKLEKNIDILKEISKKKGKTKLIGFALETDDLIKNAKKKMKEKKMDVIIANKSETLNSDKSDFILISNKTLRKFINISKNNIAEEILNEIRY